MVDQQKQMISLRNDQYVIKKQIGNGSFGIIYEVENRLQKKQYALKIQNNMKDQEFEISLKLRHKNIIQIHFIEKMNDQYYILMDLCQGDLYQILQKKIKINIQEIRYIISSISNGLKYLHDENIIHRDLKPENIFFDQFTDLKSQQTQTVYKIGDFGISKRANVTYTQNIGTIYYMAPEIILGKSYDKSVDIWALGNIIYELISGQPLFNGTTIEQIKEQILSMNNNQNNPFYKTIQQLNPPYNQLIYQMLQYNPRSRLTINQIVDKLQLNGQIIQQNNENRNFSQPKMTLYNNNQNLFQIQNQIQQSNCKEQHNNQLQNQFEKQCQQLFQQNQQNQQFLITKTDEIMCKLFNYNKELILKKKFIKQQILQIKLAKNKYFEEVNKLKYEVIKLNEEVNKLNKDMNKLQKDLDIKNQKIIQLDQLKLDLSSQLQQSQNKNQEIIHSQNIENQQFNDKIQSLIKTNQSLLQTIKMHENNNIELNNKINEIKIQNDKQNQIIQKNKIKIVELQDKIKQLNEYIKKQDFKEQVIISFDKLNEQTPQEDYKNDQIEQIQNLNTKADELNSQIEQKNYYITQLEKQVEELIQQKTSLEYNLIPQQKIEVRSSNKSKQPFKLTDLPTCNTSFQYDHNVKQNKTFSKLKNGIRNSDCNTTNQQRSASQQIQSFKYSKIEKPSKYSKNNDEKIKDYTNTNFYNITQQQQLQVASTPEGNSNNNSEKIKSKKCER